MTPRTGWFGDAGQRPVCRGPSRTKQGRAGQGRARAREESGPRSPAATGTTRRTRTYKRFERRRSLRGGLQRNRERARSLLGRLRAKVRYRGCVEDSTDVSSFERIRRTDESAAEILYSSSQRGLATAPGLWGDHLDFILVGARRRSSFTGALAIGINSVLATDAQRLMID